ncbi:uncharacterized protein LOC111135368 isoform X2 [Crassostrea virginica]
MSREIPTQMDTWKQAVTDSDNSTSSDLENIDRTHQRDMYIYVLAIILGVLVPFLTLCGIYLVFRHFKCLHHSKDCYLIDDIERKSAEKDAASPKEQVPLLSDENQGQTKESNPATQFQNCNESKQNDANMLKLKKSEEDTSGHSELSGNAQMGEWSIEKSEESKENKTAAETNNDSDSGDEEEFYESLESPLTTPVGFPMILDLGGEQGSLIEPNSQTEQTGNDVKGEEEYSNENDSHNDYTSDYESTEVFDDTKESLQREVTTEIDEQERKHCHQLYNLLWNEGRDLIREVLRLIITRTAGKTPTELLADEAVTNKLKTLLPEYCHRYLSDQTERETLIDVLYGLIQLYSGKEPKSGWGNPVKGNDTEISDDVERLHRSFHICQEITNPVAISVNNYALLCGIMLTALTRLDSEGDLKDKYKVLADKLKAIKYPKWSQSIYKMLDNIVIRWPLWQK